MPARPRCQFSLLGLMLAMAIVGVVIVLWAELVMLLSLGFHLTTVVIPFGALAAGSHMRLVGWRPRSRGYWRWVALGVLALFVFATLLAYWSASRWEKKPIEPNWPFPWPYPDT